MIAFVRNGHLVKYADGPTGPDGTLYIVTECDGEPRLHPLVYDGQAVTDIEDEQPSSVSLDLKDGRVVVISDQEFEAVWSGS